MVPPLSMPPPLLFAQLGIYAVLPVCDLHQLVVDEDVRLRS